MRRTRRTHRDDLAFDEFHAIGRRQNARLRHPQVFVRREPSFRDFDCHATARILASSKRASCRAKSGRNPREPRLTLQKIQRACDVLIAKNVWWERTTKGR